MFITSGADQTDKTANRSRHQNRSTHHEQRPALPAGPAVAFEGPVGPFQEARIASGPASEVHVLLGAPWLAALLTAHGLCCQDRNKVTAVGSLGIRKAARQVQGLACSPTCWQLNLKVPWHAGVIAFRDLCTLQLSASARLDRIRQEPGQHIA